MHCSIIITKIIFIDRLILQLKEKPLWFEPQTPPMQVPLESTPCAALEEIEKAETLTEKITCNM